MGLPPEYLRFQATQQRARRRCSRNSRLLGCLGLGVLLLNLCCGYALLSLHGVVHAPPVLITRLVASGLTATPKGELPGSELEAEADREEDAERDEWDVAEDLLAAHERAVPGAAARLCGRRPAWLEGQRGPSGCWLAEARRGSWQEGARYSAE